MTSLPPKSDLTSGLTTEAEFQSAIGSLYDYLSQLVTGATPESIEILLGSITPESTFIIVDAENEAASDDLTNILSTEIGPKIIMVRVESDARPVTLKHMASGTGQLFLNGAADAVLNATGKCIAFYYNVAENRWEELWRNWGVYAPTTADITAVLTALQLGTAAQANLGTGPSQVPINSVLGSLAYISAISSSTQINNGIITGNKLADGTIALAKMAAGTAGGLIGFNASGVPTTIPPVTAGFWLKDNGPGVPPSFQELNISSGMVFIGEGVLEGQNSANVQWTAGAYKRIYVELERCATSSSDTLSVQLYRNGALYTGNAYNCRSIAMTGASGGNITGEVRAQNIGSSSWGLHDIGNGSVSGHLWLPAAILSEFTPMYGQLVVRSVAYPIITTGIVEIETGVAITGIKVLRRDAGTFLTGSKFRVWGLK